MAIWLGILTKNILVQKQTMATLLNAADYAALKALYQSTNGPNWANRVGWSTWDFSSATPPDLATVRTWRGVTVSDDGWVTNLNLSSNRLSNSLPAELGNLSRLQQLTLGGNQLSGSIPAQLGNLTNLQTLSLPRNQLSGPIPAELGNLSNLRNLVLHANQLSGNLPSQLGNLAQLRMLYLSNNQLTDEIPAQLGNLSSLEILSLSNNQLSGNIPSQLGSLTNLNEIHLANNRISGEIPTQLGNLPSLNILALSDNQLSGFIPDTLKQRIEAGQFNVFNFNNPPTATVSDRVIEVGQSLNLAVFVSDLELDQDGDPDKVMVTFTSSNPTLIPNSAIQLSGTGANRNLSIMPVAGETGEATITLSFLDDVGETSTRSFKLTVQPATIPTSANTTVQTGEDIFYSFSLNDFPFSDSNSSDSLQSITLISVPTNGTLKLGEQVLDSAAIGNGLVISKADIDELNFTPAANANGTNYASFQFSVSDGTASSQSQTLAINVAAVNDAPTSDNQTRELAEGAAYSFQASDFVFNDVDSDSLQKIKITALPERGSLKLDGQIVTLNQEIDAADLDKLSYSPVDNENGEDYAKIDFQVSDGTDYSGLYGIFFNVSSEADAPVIAQGSSTTETLDEDSTLKLNLSASDADNDPFTWSIKTAATNGSVTVDDNGRVLYSPNPNYNGSDSFEVEVADGGGNSDSISVTVNVNPVNDAPVVSNPVVDQSAKSGEAFSFTLPQGTFSDADGDTLVLSATLSNGQSLPQWLKFDPTTGSFRGTPTTSDANSLIVKVSATDPSNSSVSNEFVLSSQLPAPAPNSGNLSNPGSNDLPNSPAPSTGSPADNFARPFLIDFNAGKPGQRVNGSSGSDRFLGSSGNDRASGGSGSDQLNGGAGNDQLNGGSGSDRVNGGSGNDLLQCGTGNDRASGGAGRDILVGGLGRDILVGGAGQDTFVFSQLAPNPDRIQDFKVSEDLINLQPMLARDIYPGASPLEKFQRYVQLEQTEQGTLVKVDTDGSGAGTRMTSLVLLQGVQASSLTASSFVVSAI